MSRDAATVTPLRPELDAGALERLLARLADTRLGPGLARAGGEAGISRDVLAGLLADWGRFEPSRLQARLDTGEHLRVEVDGLAVHVRRSPGAGSAPRPLLLTHGWPGSFLEYAELTPLLTDPGAHGADPADAFTVIAPSLPGFGFSEAPEPPLSGRGTAALWARVMDALGHARFLAHGSDLGAGVTAWLARDHPERVAAIHLATPGLAVPADVEPSPAEADFAAAVAEWTRVEGGYMHEHATKPATLAAGLADSPVGLAAWVAEKVLAWSPVRADGSPAFPRDRLLETLTLYWATDTIGSSLLPYWAFARDRGAILPAGDPSPVETAVSIFGGERVPFPKPPRELAERFFAVSAFSEHDRGGHFPAVAEPALLAAELRAAFRGIRL